PIRLGFVGLSTNGWASWLLAPPLLQEPLSSAYTLAAVSTSNATSAAKSAEHYSELAGNQVKAYHGTSTAIAADNELDMVAVSVKAPLHIETVMPIIEARKDLFIEWPAGRNLQETVALAEAAKRKGIRTMVGLQSRQSPALNKVRVIVESRVIGRVYSTTMVCPAGWSSSRPWILTVLHSSEYMADATNGAGVLGIPFGHTIDSVMFVLGPIASLTAVTKNQHPILHMVDIAGNPTGKTVEQTGVHQIALAGMLESGAVLGFHYRGGLEAMGGKAGKPLVWTIDGEKGTVLLEGDPESKVCGYINEDEPTLYLNGEKVVIAPDGKTNTGRAWAEFAKGPGGKYPTLDDAVQAKKIVDAVARSAEEGKRIAI
ncbi:NAD-binding Rossmann fold oxidoreductase, partial [Amylocystis lapponica]